MPKCVLFLRGINVGGNNLIKMAELRDIAAGLGWQNPRTYLQSGNLVVELDSNNPAKDLEHALQQILNLDVAVISRVGEELASVVSANPFTNEAKSDPSHLVVIFLPQVPPSALVERVQSAMTGPERLVDGGRELYVYYPAGIGDSKIGKTPGWKELTSSGTARNWNTVLKLASI
ncbi:MAG: DUF1697 domain-containing protein [Fimbriimonadaceae bacterium]